MISGQHHSFDILLATKYSPSEAILIHHFQHWIRINKKLKRNFKDGSTWSYQTLEEIAAHHPYWTRRQVEKIMKKLVDNGILKKGNYNRSKVDRTKWYAFVNECQFVPDFTDRNNEEIELESDEDTGISPNGEMDAPFGEMVSPFGDVRPDTKTTDTKTTTTTNAAQAQQVVAFFDELQRLEIPLAEKVWLAENYTEMEISHAIKWSQHPETKIKTNLTAAIKWACKEKPAIAVSKADKIEQNKKLASSILPKCICPANAYIQILNNVVEVGFHGANCEPMTLSYEENGFQDQFISVLRKHGINLRS